MTPEPHSVPADAQAVIVGAGPAGLIAAERLAAAGVRPFVLDAMPTPARKFLMAGRGGLNLTHSEPPADFPSRYGARAEEFRPLLAAFGPDELRAWADGLDADTFVGSSGRNSSARAP
jgi:predicted flavoprotein YhiN